MGNFDGAVKEQKHESVQEKSASLNWVDATAGEGARAAVKSNYDDAAHRFVQSQLDGHNAFGIVDSAAREPGRIASLMNEAGSYAKGVADGIHEIGEHPGQTASELWKGAKEEITQHPLRFFGTMAGGAAITVGAAMVAPLLIEGAGLAVVGEGVTALGAGMLAYAGSGAVKDLGKDLKVLNNPNADYVARKDAARDMQAYGAGLADTVAGIGGALAAGGLAYKLYEPLGLELGPSKMETRIVDVLDEGYGTCFVQKDLLFSAGKEGKTLAATGIYASGMSAIAGAFGWLDKTYEDLNR